MRRCEHFAVKQTSVGALARQGFPRQRLMMLADLFSDKDYRFLMHFERGEPGDFFAPTGQHEHLIAERRRWLRSEPDTYAGLLREGEPLLHDALKLALSWSGITSLKGVTPWETCLALGEFWEPDFLLLKTDAGGQIRLYGGCACFPSSWRLRDKLGQPIEFIHAPVPGLNIAIGPAIQKFLQKLKPGAATLRHNWGLTRSPELNHYPDRDLPRLDNNVNAEEVWLRVEHQALVALPTSGGILFGIRVVNHPLREVMEDRIAATRLGRALETMPEEVAHYKGLAAARERIVQLLRR